MKRDAASERWRVAGKVAGNERCVCLIFEMEMKKSNEGLNES